MSGTSYSTNCPNCKKEMQSYTDWKPIDLTIHTCYECGFSIRNEVYFMTLDELNDDRLNVLDIDKPLKELPKQNKDCLG